MPATPRPLADVKAIRQPYDDKDVRESVPERKKPRPKTMRMIPAFAAAALALCTTASGAPKVACTAPINITLQGEGRALFDAEPMQQSEIAPTIVARYTAPSECRVYLRSDRDVVYRDVKVLMDALQKAGVLKVAIIAHETAEPE